MRRRHAVGDVARVIRESLRDVRGRVALGTVTAPGGPSTAPKRQLGTSARASNGDCCGIGSSARCRVSTACGHRWFSCGSPNVRGADSITCTSSGGASTRSTEDRIRRWVELYREHNEAYGFGFIDDPFRRRKSRRTGRMQDMVFGRAEVAGIYLGNYLGGGQLERFVAAEDASWRAYWVSPVLQQRSGWSMERCRWIRQAFHIARGTWSTLTWYGTPRYPCWCDDGELREWTCRATGWDGVPGLASGVRHALPQPRDAWRTASRESTRACESAASGLASA